MVSKMSSQQLEQNYQYFMETDIGKYGNEWIVIVDGKIVFHNPDLKLALKTVKENASKKPLLYKVPGKETMIF